MSWSYTFPYGKLLILHCSACEGDQDGPVYVQRTELDHLTALH